MRNPGKLAAWAICGIVLAGLPARGEDIKAWIGRRVLSKVVPSPTSNVEIQGQASPDRAPSADPRTSTLDIYCVKRTNHPWLWLVAESGTRSGWVMTDAVIPFESAIDYFTDEIAKHPHDASARVHRGLVWNERDKPDAAIEDFDEAIRLAPENPDGYRCRANVWRNKQKYDKAIEDLNEVVRLTPNDARAYFLRGNISRDKKDFIAAIADYTEAIRIDPSFVPALNERGSVRSAKREYDKALKDYNDALALEARANTDQRAKADPAADPVLCDKAIAHYTEILRVKPDDILVYENRGHLWQRKKVYDRALADYASAIRLDPKSGWAYNSRAWIWATCPDPAFRNGKLALVSATRACELSHWKDPNDLDTLAAACAELGDFEHAVIWQRRANGLLTDKQLRGRWELRVGLYDRKQPYRE